jgi:hypothetical protein
MGEGLYDEDGIDGPFERRIKRAMREDAKRALWGADGPAPEAPDSWTAKQPGMKSGLLCHECGNEIDGPIPGVPRRCAECKATIARCEGYQRQARRSWRRRGSREDQ